MLPLKPNNKHIYEDVYANKIIIIMFLDIIIMVQINYNQWVPLCIKTDCTTYEEYVAELLKIDFSIQLSINNTLSIIYAMNDIPIPNTHKLSRDNCRGIYVAEESNIWTSTEIPIPAGVYWIHVYDVILEPEPEPEPETEEVCPTVSDGMSIQSTIAHGSGLLDQTSAMPWWRGTDITVPVNNWSDACIKTLSMKDGLTEYYFALGYNNISGSSNTYISSIINGYNVPYINLDSNPNLDWAFEGATND